MVGPLDDLVLEFLDLLGKALEITLCNLKFVLSAVSFLLYLRVDCFSKSNVLIWSLRLRLFRLRWSIRALRLLIIYLHFLWSWRLVLWSWFRSWSLRSSVALILASCNYRRSYDFIVYIISTRTLVLNELLNSLAKNFYMLELVPNTVIEAAN